MVLEEEKGETQQVTSPSSQRERDRDREKERERERERGIPHVVFEGEVDVRCAQEHR